MLNDSVCHGFRTWNRWHSIHRLKLASDAKENLRFTGRDHTCLKSLPFFCEKTIGMVMRLTQNSATSRVASILRTTNLCIFIENYWEIQLFHQLYDNCTSFCQASKSIFPVPYARKGFCFGLSSSVEHRQTKYQKFKKSSFVELWWSCFDNNVCCSKHETLRLKVDIGHTVILHIHYKKIFANLKTF